MTKKWLKPWGPKPLRERITQLQNEVDARTPIPGLGINVTDDKGKKISTKAADAAAPGAMAATGGSSGTSVDVYGSLNGAPAVFHLLQSADPTALP